MSAFRAVFINRIATIGARLNTHPLNAMTTDPILRGHSSIHHALSCLSCRHITSASSVSKDKAGEEEEVLSDKPVQFSTSKAAKWRAEYTWRGTDEESDVPAIQPFIVSLSLIAFLVYFCILREENDVDRKLDSEFILETIRNEENRTATKSD